LSNYNAFVKWLVVAQSKSALILHCAALKVFWLEKCVWQLQLHKELKTLGLLKELPGSAKMVLLFVNVADHDQAYLGQ